MVQKDFVKWFEEVGIKDVGLVGGKTASLGEMIRELTAKGVRVPSGFAITAHAYRYIMEKSGAVKQVREILKGLDTHDVKDLAVRGAKIRKIIEELEFPADLDSAIRDMYKQMCERYKTKDVSVAVRSSATAEDLPDASFAGQQETYLNIQGDKALIDACKKCFASLFTNRAISYRVDKNFDHFDVALSIAVQKMIRSDSACSGVMFTIDTESGFKDAVFITGAWGLGETVVQGAVNPDEYNVFKPTLKLGKRPIVSKMMGAKKIKMVYAGKNDKSKRPVKIVDTTAAERSMFVVNEDEILLLAKWGCIIEDHYSAKAGYFKPMDIEWAKDGDGKKVGTGELYIVQARPETVHSQKSKKTSIKTFKLKGTGKVLCTGQAVGEQIGQGIVNMIMSSKDISKFQKGQILVTDMTDPDWEPIMKIAGAIVTNRGGRTCHAAIVSRELGITCVIGTENATKTIKSGQKVTVSCADGEQGKIYDGIIPFDVTETSMGAMPKTRTKVMMNTGVPELAFKQGQIPNDGVGLAREEFIINSYIGIHPMALVNYDELKKLAKKDKKVAKVVAEIDRKTTGYTNKTKFFVDNLAQGIARIAAGFYPNDVVVRLSDFKSNEYANLLGGYLYEPHEENPMIGWRGASRYYNPKYEPAFALECYAIKKVRDEMGLTNVIPMVPFCRTPEEGRKVVDTCAKYGLKQGENGLQFYVMAEIPSNCIAAAEFSEIFDGFSIGSNDLTQLTLGLDRDSQLVASIFNERHIAVKRMVAMVIKTAREHHRKIGICGQAPSDFPEFAAFLVECGIDSISLNPDTVIKTKLFIAQKEKELGINPQ
jgi:pyruvate, water dikinase